MRDFAAKQCYHHCMSTHPNTPRSGPWTGDKDSHTKIAANDLVMAWAQQHGTGTLRYILELGPHERGSKCNCVCISCGQPLTAVNAAKEVFSIRPHFRHPDGSPKDACMVLAARAALMEALLGEDTLLLPRRRQSSRVEGLSGDFHDAWVELPPESVRVANVKFHDRLRALLTLDDGRQLVVQLVGSAQTQVDGSVIPSIDILVDDPAIAAMPLDEIRRRLAPFLENACWRGHWQDSELLEQAEAQAREKAVNAFDWDDFDGLPEDTPSDLRRETLLHRLVKLILAQHKKIWLPALSIRIERQTDIGMVVKESLIPERLVHLRTVVLERRLGRIVPDVLAKQTSGEDLLIEVTVTNRITDERINRIRGEGCAALEIDIGRMGGRVTRAELERLVVKEVAAKRWLYHPQSGEVMQDLERQLDVEHTLQKSKQYRSGLAGSQSASMWAEQYLDAIERCADSRLHDEEDGVEDSSSEHYLDLAKEAAAGLSGHGYPEAEHQELYFRQRNVITRLLSIKQDRSVGYKLLTAWQVINTIVPESQKYGKWHTLYLMAIRTYKPKLTTEQDERIQLWRKEVWESIQAGETRYQRDTKYDRLLSLLFPEMRVLLERPRNIDQSGPIQRQTRPRASRTEEPAKQAAAQTPAPSFPITPADAEGHGLWLKGRQLADWKRRNPEAAKHWFKERS